MKKFICSLILMTFALCVNAQSSSQALAGVDTMTNSETDYLTIAPVGFYEQVSFQFVGTKLSGTVAGYALLQHSNDGTNYTDVNTDTLTLANTTTNSYVFVLTYNPSYYYRVKIVTSGTMSLRISGTFLGGGQRGKHAVQNMLSSYSATSDTITNTATGYVGITVNNYYTRLSIMCLVTKISGTVAGTVTLQGSVDGTNYVTVSSSYATSTTLSTTNTATQSKVFIITGSPYKYYRLSYTGSGTMSATLKGFVTPNK